MVLTIVFIAACLIVGYFCGTISTAYIVGKQNNIDIREVGSKNAGTTNTMRALGKKAGIIVFLGDCIKAVVAMLIMLLIGLLINTSVDVETIKLATGFGAVLGHNFPFWLGFKGGKGIAVTGAVIIAFCFDKSNCLCIFVCLALFVLIVKFTKYVSLGSLAVVTTFLLYVALAFRNHSAYIRLLILTLLFVLLAFYMHRSNIVRLLNGTENKIGQKKLMDNNYDNKMNNNMVSRNTNNQMDNGQYRNNNGQMRNMNEQMNLNQINRNQMSNGSMNNNNSNINNQVFLDPSELVDTNIEDFSNQNRRNDEQATNELYNTDYFNGINNAVGNANDFDMDISDSGYYKGYEECDTLDETRQLTEEELLDDSIDGFDSTKSYYDKF